MDQDKILIETMGYIKKEKNLSTVEANIVQNTLVLESLNRFPDYHGKNLPESPHPRSLYLIVDKAYPQDEFYRITKKIKTIFNYDFNASLGNIFFKTTTYPCIRIKYLKSFSFLPELQLLFQNEGVKFAKQKSINQTGLININKHFYVEELLKGVYRDMEEHSKFYIELPQALTWDEFIEMTTTIKNNIDNSDFDAAQGVFYRKTDIIEVVRLYICEGEFEKVKIIQKMYIDLINKKYK